MSKYFSIPHDNVLGLPVPKTITPTGDYHFSHDKLSFWAQVDQGSRQVVVLVFNPDSDPIYAIDGEWRQQLESCTGGCSSTSGHH